MVKRISPSSRASRTVHHGVGNTESVLVASAIAALMIDYGIPKGMAYCALDLGGKANAPPEDFITVYEHHLKGGSSTPMPCNLYTLVEALAVSIARLHPNVVRYLVS
ncbi:hypothetical protein Nepgr_011620 [Nepenthes gracilis]|uniref:Uncharacterized protein n=1 Tax=Nepenthes gracilis TaxID=150966 RepID=A0AAD3XMG8_NEPGR|nr:hypothetical protein Nepgr_011620 [Nepenthes gracilis]